MCANGHHMSRFSFATASVRTSSEKRVGVRGAVAILGLMGATLTSPSHAQQAPSLLTAASFAVLAGSTVTNTEVWPMPLPLKLKLITLAPTTFWPVSLLPLI